MTAGLGIDRLIDLLLQVVGWFKFWIVIDPFQRAVIITLGKIRRKKPVLGPGIHWIAPFGIEEDLTDNVVPSNLSDLTIDMTLRCGTPLHIEMSILWEIIDVLKFQLEIEGAEAVLVNVQGMVQEYLFQYEWEELMGFRNDGIGDRRKGLPWKLKVHCNQETRQWGAELTNLYIQSFIRPDLRKGVVKSL